MVRSLFIVMVVIKENEMLSKKNVGVIIIVIVIG